LYNDVILDVVTLLKFMPIVQSNKAIGRVSNAWDQHHLLVNMRVVRQIVQLSIPSNSYI